MYYDDIIKPNFHLDFWINNCNDWSIDDIDDYLDFLEKPTINSLGFGNIDYDQEPDYSEVLYIMLKEMFDTGEIELKKI